MNMPETESLKACTPTKTPSKTHTIIVNVNFEQLAQAANNPEKSKELQLVHQFNGEGRNIIAIPEEAESEFIEYSQEQPIDVNDGDKIKFKLQAMPSGSSVNKDVEFEWKGIIQNRYDLRLIAGKQSKYLAVATDVSAAPEGEIDNVFIQVDFTINQMYKGSSFMQDFSASWDPRIRIRL